MPVVGERRKEVLAELKRLSETATIDLDPAEFARNMHGESDRGAVMLAATMVDDALKERLFEHFSAANKEDRKALFGFSGPAGTFSSRILLARSLDIIDVPERASINVIRHMRNACAHAQNNLNFDSPPLRAAFELLVTETSTPIADMPRDQIRDLFVLHCGFTAGNIRLRRDGGEVVNSMLPLFNQFMRDAPVRWVMNNGEPPE